MDIQEIIRVFRNDVECCKLIHSECYEDCETCSLYVSDSTLLLAETEAANILERLSLNCNFDTHENDLDVDDVDFY